MKVPAIIPATGKIASKLGVVLAVVVVDLVTSVDALRASSIVAIRVATNIVSYKTSFLLRSL
jgi:hypothetical protein